MLTTIISPTPVSNVIIVVFTVYTILLGILWYLTNSQKTKRQKILHQSTMIFVIPLLIATVYQVIIRLAGFAAG